MFNYLKKLAEFSGYSVEPCSQWDGPLDEQLSSPPMIGLVKDGQTEYGSRDLYDVSNRLKDAYKYKDLPPLDELLKD